MTFKRIKVRLYPTVKQKEMLDNHFNAYRYCYNLSLEYKQRLWTDHQIHVSGYDMQNELFELRKGVPWILECKAECIRDAGLQVDKAYKGFFNQNKGFPKFKSKNNVQSFSAYQSIKIQNEKLKFYGSYIKISTSKNYENLLKNNKIKQVTFKKDKCGDYWATCLIEVEQAKLEPINKVTGIDLGLKSLVITSEGDIYENPKYLLTEKYKLRKLQRKFSKTKKGGKNREKLRIKIAKLHRKITSQREHYYHQITNELIRENQTIIMETLRVKNMAKNHNLARAINDASWGLLTQILEYKCKWYGRELIKIGTFFPSSKTCSCCGHKKEELKLSERTFSCENCGLEIDRDLNAAINIKNEGLKISGLPVEDTDNSQANETGSNNS